MLSTDDMLLPTSVGLGLPIWRFLAAFKHLCILWTSKSLSVSLGGRSNFFRRPKQTCRASLWVKILPSPTRSRIHPEKIFCTHTRRRLPSGSNLFVVRIRFVCFLDLNRFPIFFTIIETYSHLAWFWRRRRDGMAHPNFQVWKWFVKSI